MSKKIEPIIKVSRCRRTFASVRLAISSLPEGNFENKYVGRTCSTCSTTPTRKSSSEKHPRIERLSLSLSLPIFLPLMLSKKYCNTRTYVLEIFHFFPFSRQIPASEKRERERIMGGEVWWTEDGGGKRDPRGGVYPCGKGSLNTHPFRTLLTYTESYRECKLQQDVLLVKPISWLALALLSPRHCSFRPFLSTCT